MRWLGECALHHEMCPLRKDPSGFLPTRLLDVGSAPEFSDLRVVDSSSLPRARPYLTLSHCWGSGPMFRLLRSNIEELKMRVPFERLSRTFQHAIMTTRRISAQYGICYIWIDSLCIIQDSIGGSD